MTKTITQLEGRERRTWHLAFVEPGWHGSVATTASGGSTPLGSPTSRGKTLSHSLGLTQEPV